MTFPSSRTPISSQTPVADRTGQKVLDNYSLHISALWQVSWLRLSGATGTNAVVATVNPPLINGPEAGMHFTIVWPTTNTGAVTLDLGFGPHAVVAADGETPAPGLLAAGMVSALEFDGANYRLIGGIGGIGDSGSATPTTDRQIFTASGTWTKPQGFPDDAMVTVRLWGGGGGATAASNGNSGAGGGGGAYVELPFLLGDLPNNVAVTVGAGGSGAVGSAAAGDGGSSSFGTFASASGGKGAPSTSMGGRGGGVNPGLPADTSNNVPATPGGDIWSGGGGGAGSGGGSGGGLKDGGWASMAGGGGAGRSSGSSSGLPGVSLAGGNGGAADLPGQAPGGGGGGGNTLSPGSPGGKGGDGRVEVIVR